jgi:hypothetical protein
MDLFNEIMLNNDNGERDFKGMVEEFIQLIEKKLMDAEFQMFDSTYVFFQKNFPFKLIRVIDNVYR